jgi:hypothetical protein
MEIHHFRWLKQFRSAKCIPIFVLFFISFNRYTHFLIAEFIRKASDSNMQWFVERWQLDSDMLVRSRLQTNLDHGVFSYVFSLGTDGEYSSQVGLGGWILTLPVYLLHRIGILGSADYSLPAPQIGVSGFIGLGILYSMIAALNAGLATWCICQIRNRANRVHALIFAAMLLQPWSLAINSSLYWMIGLKLLPGIYVTHLVLNKKPNKLKQIIILFSLSILAFSSGYEFSTVVLISVVSPLVFFSITQMNGFKNTIAFNLKHIATVIFAFLFTLVLHTYIMFTKFGTFILAKEQMSGIVHKRTGLLNTKVDLIYKDSLEAGPIPVLVSYLKMPVAGDPISPKIANGFHVWHIIVLITISWIWKTIFTQNQNLSKVHLGLGAAWFVGLLGPIGWYLLARPHSAGHTHINFTLWFFFTLPFGASLLYGRYPKFQKKTNNGAQSVLILLSGFLLIVAMLLISQFLLTRGIN